MQSLVVHVALMLASASPVEPEAPGATFNLGRWADHDSTNVAIHGDSEIAMWLAVEVAGDPDLGLDWSERGLALVQVSFGFAPTHPNFAQWKLIGDPEQLPGEGMYPSIVSPGPNVVTMAAKSFIPINLGIFGITGVGPGQAIAYRQRKGTNLYLDPPSANFMALDPALDSADAKPHIVRDFSANTTHVCWTRESPASSGNCRAQDVVSVTSPMSASPPLYVVSAANANGVAAEEDHCMMDFMRDTEQNVRYTVFHRQNLCNGSGDHHIRLDIASFNSAGVGSQIADFVLADSTGNNTPDGDFPSIYIRQHGGSLAQPNRATVLVAAQERGALDQDRVLIWQCTGTRNQCDQTSEFTFSEFAGGANDTFFDPKIFAVGSTSFAALPSTEHQFIVYARDYDSSNPDSDHEVRLLSKCSGEPSWTDEGRLPIQAIGLGSSRTWLGTPPAPAAVGLSRSQRDPPSASQASVFVASNEVFFVSFVAESNADAEMREVLLYKGTVADFCPRR